jgi:hypothetical protein
MLHIQDIANHILITQFLRSDKLSQYVEPPQAKDLPEDTEITSITIPSTRLMSDHVLYQIDGNKI